MPRMEMKRPSVGLLNQRPLKRSEVIARQLIDHIIDSGLTSGSKLPREQDMAEQLGVGRTTLREALRLLESRGMLTIRSGPGGGPVVRHPEPSDLTDALLVILQFQRATMLEILDARIMFESAAAGLAATRITSTELDRLRELNEEISAVVGADHETALYANKRFHRLIAAASGNIVVQTFVDTLLEVADDGFHEIHHTRAFKRAVADGHALVIKALEARDPDAAEEAMRAHIEEGKARRLKASPAILSRPLRWVK
jgi:DNA-binding FadR family transcriptional regulator